MEVEPQEAFESHLMTDFLKGKIKTAASDLFQSDKTTPKQPLIFSAEAYMKCITSLREPLHVLETKLQPKGYAYGFLKA
ncbi:MAG: hypothetical protein RL329_1150 [Bacteroidota bacterium]|jgi:hypothetical protein